MSNSAASLTLPIPNPDPAWREIKKLAIQCYFGLRYPDFTAAHAIKYRQDLDPLLGTLCGVLSQQLGPKTHLTCAVNGMPIEEVAAMLGRSADEGTSFVALRAEGLNGNNPVHISLWEKWSPLFYALLRFVIPTDEPLVTQLEPGDSREMIKFERR